VIRKNKNNADDDDDDGGDAKGLAGRLSLYPDGSLVISDVRRTDSGWYMCRPGTGLALPSEAAAFLNVTCKYQQQPSIVKNSKRKCALLSSNAFLYIAVECIQSMGSLLLHIDSFRVLFDKIAYVLFYLKNAFIF